jgi:capsular polysaccharide transport system permease protein
VTLNLDSLGRQKSASGFAVSARVIYAFMLRDIKTRFFGSGLGYLVYMAWPFVHLFVIVGIAFLTGRRAPYGDSIVLYSAVSLLPFLFFNYVSRYIAYAIVTNRSLLNFPIASVMDLILARSILEFISITLTMIVVFAIISLFGATLNPHDVVDFFYCLVAVSLFSIATGIIFCILGGLLPPMLIVQVFIIIIAYLISGILFMPAALPQPYRDWLWYNPLTQLTEWCRFAVFGGYPDEMISRPYIWGYILVLWFVALGLERLMRGRLLQG